MAAAAAGALWGLCFGREPATLASWVALVPLFLLLGGPRPGRLGFIHGVAFWLVSIPWIAPTLASFGQLPVVLAWGLLLLLACYLALFTALFGALGGRLWRRRGALSLLGLAGLWVVLEWLRALLLSGFPWNLAGTAWVEQPGALALSSWVGVYGVSFVLVAANGAVARTLATGRGGGLLAGVPCCLLLLAVAARWVGDGAPTAEPRPWPGGAPRVALVQPNISNQVVFDPDRGARDYARLLELSRSACSAPGTLIVWPESAAWPYSYDRHEFLRRDLAGLAERGCPVLINSVSHEGEHYFNSALLVGPGGVVARYDKVHLVPFGEYVPGWISWLPFVGKIARQVGSFSAGEEPRLLPWHNERLGVSICFEITFPAEVARTVRRGATALVTITNDAWYGDTAAPWQHLRAARFRAAENRRPLLRAAITGVSARLAPDGSQLATLGVFEQGTLTGGLAGSGELSPYTRRPWLSPLGALILAGFAILRAFGRTR